MQWVQGIRVKSYVHSICDNSTLGGIYFVYLSIFSDDYYTSGCCKIK